MGCLPKKVEEAEEGEEEGEEERDEEEEAKELKKKKNWSGTASSLRAASFHTS